MELRARVPPEVTRELVRRLRRAMQAAGVRDEVSLLLTGDRQVRALNRAYAGEDHATDVLSFSQREGDGVRPGPGAKRRVGCDGPGAKRDYPLGDIVISVPTAKRQAAARPLVDELAHLAVHGLAHLLGYDHATQGQQRVMFGWEARLRAQAEGRGPVVRVRRP